MKDTNEKINNDWDIILKDALQKASFKKMMTLLYQERINYTIYPSQKNIFKALCLSPFSSTKVVILGQDPYHRKGQANGLAFSVPVGKQKPPSLRNIFKELKSDLDIETPQNGNLEDWAKQGVLLLNTSLTVREKKAGSHQKIGWTEFTDTIISKLSMKKKGLIFLLWGESARKKSSLINTEKHYVLKTTHPSPLSAYKGFFGCKHFSKTNKILVRNNQKPINWQLCSDILTLY